ncbi:MAG: DNA-binding response regulator, partial [Planctomycetaceae bacterium]|nr:DNA-binding response regulator [Planctomycetaceae bacterium]
MARKRILIIEDDAALVEVLEYNLEQAGYQVSVARGGRAGLHVTESVRPDLILLDVMLPEMDGIEVCRQLRAHESTRDVLILMLTAKSQELDELIGFSVGADDYVTKPFSVNVLLQRIKSLIRRQEPTRQNRDTATSQGIAVDRK